MTLQYEQLISPDPIHIPNVGSIQVPKVRNIVNCYPTYQTYIYFLLLNPEKYYEVNEQSDYYHGLSFEETSQINVFDLLIQEQNMIPLLKSLLEFFFTDQIQYDFDNQMFILCDGRKDEDGNLLPTGIINADNWTGIADLILQLNNINNEEEKDDFENAMDERALALQKKFAAHRKKMKKDKPIDHSYDIGNVISKVATLSANTNYLQVFDLTIYQLWDAFRSLKHDDFYRIESRSVSIWGDEKKQFSPNSRYENLVLLEDQNNGAE